MNYRGIRTFWPLNATSCSTKGKNENEGVKLSFSSFTILRCEKGKSFGMTAGNYQSVKLYKKKTKKNEEKTRKKVRKKKN